MRKILFVLAATVAMFLNGCNKDSAGLSPDTTGTEVDMEVLTSTAARYAVASDTVTVKHCKGKLTEIASEAISSSITSYLTATYPGSEVLYAAVDERGKTVIAIKLADGTKQGLLFNEDGTVSERMKNHLPKANLTEVAITSLSATITDYIAANFAGFAIKKAGSNDVGEFLVGISDETSMKIVLFNADGSFKSVLEKPKMKRKGKSLFKN
mgnify:CR=1 FL=1